MGKPRIYSWEEYVEFYMSHDESTVGGFACDRVVVSFRYDKRAHRYVFYGHALVTSEEHEFLLPEEVMNEISRCMLHKSPTSWVRVKESLKKNERRRT